VCYKNNLSESLVKNSAFHNSDYVVKFVLKLRQVDTGFSQRQSMIIFPLFSDDRVGIYVYAFTVNVAMVAPRLFQAGLLLTLTARFADDFNVQPRNFVHV